MYVLDNHFDGKSTILIDDYIINDFKPITASEDFAFMLQKVPGCYIFVGNGLDGAQGCSGPKGDRGRAGI